MLSSDKGKARRPGLARKPEGLKADKGLIFSSLLNFEVAGASRAQCRHIQDGFFLSVQETPLAAGPVLSSADQASPARFHFNPVLFWALSARPYRGGSESRVCPSSLVSTR